MIIELKNIKKRYDRVVLKDVSLRLESGKLYVIKGVSGCGKTTLFNIIGGLEKKYKGKIEIYEDKNYKKKYASRENIGYVFQYSLLFSKITVMENLLFIRNDKEKIMEICERLGICRLLEKYPEQLSGGERQRISIVRALLAEPKIFLADEPTASLDKRNSEKIAELITELKSEDKVILVATHEHYFDEVADEIIYLNYGTVEKVKCDAER